MDLVNPLLAMINDLLSTLGSLLGGAAPPELPLPPAPELPLPPIDPALPLPPLPPIQ